MALPTNGLARTMCQVPQKISDTFLKRSSNSLLQIAAVTGNARRSKSAVPGWYKRMSMGSNNVPSDMQYAGMSPSTRFVTSSKNGALIKSVVKNNDIVPKEYLINQLNSLSRSISDIPKPMMAPRARSLPRWSEANNMMDRETDQVNSRDIKLRGTISLTELSQEGTHNLENTLPAMEAEHNISENIEEIEKSLMSSTDKTARPAEKDLATSFKRTLNINLNDLDPVIAEAKKNLSMDINVIVSVKSPENGLNPEIGFKELPRKESEHGTRRNMQSTGTLDENNKLKETEIPENLKITDSEAAENLKFGSEQCLFTQKDITEEIGKVYNFLKTNDGTKSILINNNPLSSNTVQNYDAVKKLYVNALGCVKACEELKNNAAVHRTESDTEFSQLINELEGCFSAQDDTTNSEKISENPIGSQGNRRKQFLAGTRSDAVGIRMYSAKSDCLKATKLPCLQSSELSKGGQDPNAGANSKSVCEKLCMPCCKPARDPPRCFYPYHKPPCKKLKPPRPAFSECKRLFELKQVTPCECVKPRATRCKKSDDSATCDKR